MAGSFIFCEANAFREVGGFSNELFAGEEIDLSRRLKQLARARKKRSRDSASSPAADLGAEDAPLHAQGASPVSVQGRAVSHKRILTSRDECHTWYDGRR